MSPNGTRRYSAFISYSHSDEVWARWLHRKIEGYRIPHDLVGSPGPNGPLTKRFSPIFRDREELAAGGNLKQEIEEALSRSDALIVLCSPRAAVSLYVNKEAAYFKSMGRGDRILPVILEGDPSESFPPALADGIDRLGADLRKERDGRENGLLKILAGMLGVGLNVLVQRERAAQRRRMRIAVGLSLGFASLAFLAVAFGIRSEQLRVWSEANRLAAESRSATEQDLALLLAVAAYRIDANESSRNALFAANLRSPRLVGMTRASGEIKDIHLLPDGRAVLLVAGRTVSPMALDADASLSSLKPINGLPPDVLELTVANHGKNIIARDENEVGIYDLNSRNEVKLLTVLPVDKDTLMAGAARAKVAVALQSKGLLETFDITTGTLLSAEQIPLPFSEATDLRISPDGETVALAAKDEIWLRTHRGWRALPGAESRPSVLIDITFDFSGELLVAVEGVDQNWEGPRETAAKMSRMRCWRTDLGDTHDCPTIGAIAAPARLGIVSQDLLTLYRRDPVTGYQVAELWAEAGNEWKGMALRNDPTFVTALAASPSGERILVGTIDGDLFEYSVRRFGPGGARPYIGEPILVDWQASGCRVVSRIEGWLASQDCDGSDSRRVDLADDVTVLTTDSGSRLVFTIGPDRSIIGMDSSLSVKLTAPVLPEGIDRYALNVVGDLAIGALIVADGDVPGLFRFDRGNRDWRRLSSADIPARVMALNNAGNTVYLGRSDNGAITAVDAASGVIQFETLIPSTQFTQRILVAPDDMTLYVSVFTSRHSLFKLDARTGKIISDDFNRFSGPARIKAASGDRNYLVVSAIGHTDGQSDLAGLDGYDWIEVVDAQQLLPIGFRFRTRADEWRAAFSPDSTELGRLKNQVQRGCGKAGSLLPALARAFAIPGSAWAAR